MSVARVKDSGHPSLNQDVHLEAKGEREARAEDGDAAERAPSGERLRATGQGGAGTHENVLPKRRGVLRKRGRERVSISRTTSEEVWFKVAIACLIKTSEFEVSQP